MCWAMLVGAGLNAAGGAMQRREQDQSALREVRARNRELTAFNQKNDAATAVNQSTFGDLIRRLGSDTLGTAQTARVADATGNVTDVVPGPEMAFSINAPQVVQAEYAKRAREALEKGKTTAGNLGRLSGYAQQQANAAIDANTANNAINMQNQFVQGNAAILPHLQDYRAIEAYRPSSGLGSIMQAAGQMVARMPMGAPGGMPGTTPMMAPMSMPHAARIGF